MKAARAGSRPPTWTRYGNARDPEARRKRWRIHDFDSQFASNETAVEKVCVMSVNTPQINSPLTGLPFPSLPCPARKSKSQNVSHDGRSSSTLFRSDYTAPPVGFTRTRPVTPLPPASVIHTDTKFLPLQVSHTQNTYRPPGGGSPPGRSCTMAEMHSTHFHMVADRRLETHCTTHQDGFQPLQAGKQPSTSTSSSTQPSTQAPASSQPGSSPKSQSTATKSPTVTQRFARRVPHAHNTSTPSPGPLGNKTGNGVGHSEYSSSFPSATNDARDRPFKREGVGLQWVQLDGGRAGRDTITGTKLAHTSPGSANWATTHRSTFRGTPPPATTPPPPPPLTTSLQQLGITSIPQGEVSTSVQPASTTHHMYLPPPPGFATPAYNKLAAVRAIHGTSLHLGNHTPVTTTLGDHIPDPQNGLSTTAADTYRNHDNPSRTVPLIRFPRNASYLSPGDLDSARVKSRVNHTTTSTSHQKPLAGSYPQHVDGSNLHTFSQVHLGGTSLQPLQGSTMADSYPPISVPTHRVRPPSRDNIPLDYCTGHLCSSTTVDSYCKPARVAPTSVPMDDLKCSHWQLPSTGIPSYATTHRDCFSVPQTVATKD